MLYAAAILFAAPITVRFAPPEKGRATVTVTVRTADSEPFSVQAKVVDGRLEGIAIPEAARSLTIETPVHSPCELRRPFIEPCELKSLTVFEPFVRGRTGRLWSRRAGDEKASWEVARRLSREDGPGFALPEEALDVVLAPEREAASLHLGVFPSQLRGARGVPDDVDPATLVARVVDPGGSAFLGRLRVSLMSSDAGAAAAVRHKAWKSFYDAKGSSFEKGGLLRISPLPRESLVFSLRVDGYSGVTLSSRGKARDRVIDAGTIRLRRPISLTVVLQSSVPADELPRNLSLSLRHERGAAGFLAAGVPAAKAIRVGEPVEFKDLSPGVWRLVLGGDGIVRGFKEVNLAQPGETIAMSLEMAQVEGVVRLRDETPVANAHVLVGKRNSERDLTETETDREGHFQARFLHAAGVVDIRAFRDASDDGESIEDIDPASVEAQSLRLTLRGGAVRIRVLNKETQRPVPEVWVTCHAPALRGQLSSRQTNAEGVASFGGLPVGEWACEARAKGFASQKTKPFRNSEEGVTEHRLDLSTTRTLRGVVMGSSGSAVRGEGDGAPGGEPA